MRHPMRLELTREGLLVKLTNHYTHWGNHHMQEVVIYEAFCFDVIQGRINGTSNETRGGDRTRATRARHDQ